MLPVNPLKEQPMFSVFSFLLTFMQLAIIITSYVIQAKTTFYLWVVYGSPFYLVMNLLNNESAFFDSNPIYLLLGFYHIVKYLIMFKAQRNADRPGLFYTSIAFEIFYLCMSGYYMN
jgi:hypothetical protein